MQKEAVLHRHGFDWVYALNREELVFRLRTKRNDVTRVRLHWKDKYLNMRGKHPAYADGMELAASDEFFDYWETTLKPEGRSLFYLFELVSASETWYYGDCRFFSRIPEEPRSWYEMPNLNESDVFTVPEWVKDAVVYQIIPDRFCNGNPANDPPGTSDWNTQVRSKTMLGGDFEGIIQKLDYLSDLGINTIYMTPVFLSDSNHKYNTFDYFQVDPQFGSLDTLKELTSKAHSKGIRVVLDAVFNHCGTGFFAFQDLLKNQEKSKYRDWFDVRKFPVSVKEFPNYASFGYFGSMPKLMSRNPEVSEYLLKVASYWIREADIDGWRIDVATEVDHQFWRHFRETVKAQKSDAVIIGEIWHDAAPWLNGDQFDTTMNYPFRESVIGLAASGALTLAQFNDKLGFIRGNYRRQAWDILWNLLGSHDTERILRVCGDNKDRMKLCVLLQMTLPGVPMVYYGDEIGMSGGGDPDCRMGMVWDEDRQDLQLLDYCRKLISLRKRLNCIRRGAYEVCHLDEERRVFGFRRSDGEEIVTVYVNAGSKPCEVKPEPRLSGIAAETLTVSVLDFSRKGAHLALPAYGAALLEWKR